MVIEADLLIEIFIILLLFILSAFPLHRAVKVMKGKTKFTKTLFIVLITGIVVSLVNFVFNVFGGLIAFIFLIWAYHKSFKLKWWKAFMVWVLQLAFVIVGSIIVSVLFNIFSNISLFFN